MIGGIKKKFQINALKRAERRTGRMSNKTAFTETTSSKIRAMTRNPIKLCAKKQTTAVSTTRKVLMIACFDFENFLV